VPQKQLESGLVFRTADGADNLSRPAHSISGHDVRVASRQPGGGVGAGISVAVLSIDDTLITTLSEVVTSDHSIAIAPDALSLVEQIIAINAGVVIIDADAVADDNVATLRKLRAQFPDLVLVAAGNSAQQSRLANMVTDGSVYRFLHKPVSGQRVRQFIDASLRRYDEQRGAAAEIRRAQDAVASSAMPATKIPVKILLGGCAAIALLALVLWLTLGNSSMKRATVVSTGIAATGNAVGADQDRQMAALLDRAEKALQTGRVDEATLLLGSASRLQPDNARLTFLLTELSKTRERATLAQARNAAASGDYDKAFATLDSANAADRTTLNEARRDLSQQQGEDRLRTLLRLAQERLNTGAIIEPANDNARFYTSSARILAARDPATLRIVQTLQRRMLQEARASAGRAEAVATEKWLGFAREDGASPSDVDAVRRILSEARASLKTAELSRLSTQVRQRIVQDRLVEPADDSAQFWLAKLRDLDGTAAATVEMSQLLAEKLLVKARTGLAADDLESAKRWLRSADSVAGRSLAGASIAADIAAREERQKRDQEVIGVGSLKRVKFIEPVYPATAFEKKISGWVDLEFTLLKDGSVANIQILDAQPSGIFDSAARKSVIKWRFTPVERDGSAVEQRVRMRLRFSLPD
jgi:TonB family protein